MPDFNVRTIYFVRRHLFVVNALLVLLFKSDVKCIKYNRPIYFMRQAIMNL